MIDLLLFDLFLAAALAAYLHRSRAFAPVLALLMAAHAFSLVKVFTAPVPAFDLVEPGGNAEAAGVNGAGRVLSVNGEEPASLGHLIASVLEGVDVVTTKGSFRAPGRQRYPWEFLDGAVLEEAAGGLALLPRRPVMLATASDPIDVLLPSGGATGRRLESAAGKPTRTVGDLLAALHGMPDSGVALLRVMRPTPDDNVASVYFTPSGTPAPLVATESARLLRALAIGGVFVYAEQGATKLSGFVNAVDGAGVSGPSAFAGAVRRGLDSRGAVDITFRSGGVMRWRTGEGSLVVRPRAVLLPWIGGGPLVSFAVGLPGSLLGQLANLARLPSVLRNLPLVPPQAYALDDAALAEPGHLAFRCAGVAGAFLLALLLWELARRALPTGLAGSARARTLFLVLVVLALRFAGVMTLISFR